MKVYSVGDVADYFNLKPTTIRKYCMILEKENYHFKRNSRNQRYFDDKDIITLQSVLRAKNNGMTLQESVMGVLKANEHVTVTDAMNHGSSHDNGDIHELKNMIRQLSEKVDKQSEKLNKQQEYINESLKERDRNLMQTMNEMMETRRQLASTEGKKPGFLSKLFGRE